MPHLFCSVCHKLLLPGVAENRGALDIDAELTGTCENGSRQPGLKIIGTIAEIGLCRTDMNCIGHRIFASLRKPEDTVGEFLFFFVGQFV